MAEADATRVKKIGEADALRVKLIAQADAEKEAKVGVGKAIAIDEQVRAYGGPQLQLMQDVMTKLATAIESSKVPIVPSTVVNMGGESGDSSSMNAFGLLMGLMATDKLGEFTEAAERPIDPSQLQMVAEIKKQMRDQAVAEAKQPAKPKAPEPPAPSAEV